MKTKFAERLPKEQGAGLLTDYPAIRSPWGRLYDFHYAMKYVARANHVISAAILNAYRILVPDYAERTQLMCESVYKKFKDLYSGPYGDITIQDLNIHPFCRGNFMGCLVGDTSDERLFMAGRVNDFDTYRVEKELDTCPWDICGSELCRSTTVCFQGIIDGISTKLRSGPMLELNMVEALGCGDRHCRIVGECRKKYPMPEKPLWESFGPIATDDYLSVSTEEYCEHEPSMFRPESGYQYVTGTNKAFSANDSFTNTFSNGGEGHILPAMAHCVELGRLKKENVDYALKCVCEAAGKAAFGEFFAKEGLRAFLGVPVDIGEDDGRLLGGYIEMYLQARLLTYETEMFTQEEVIYVVDSSKITPEFMDCLISYWYGASKTLINAQWSLWEEDSPEGKTRIKIAKKIDKFC